MISDLRMAVRSFARSPGFTGLAVLTLALGIAANTAILSVVNGVLLRPLPYAEPDRIVTFWTTTAAGVQGGQAAGDFVEILDEQRIFTALAGYRQDLFSLLAPTGERIEVEGAHVTAPFFDVFGVPPLAGRAFTAADAGSPVIVLSEDAWRRGLGADADAIGSLVTVNGRDYTLVGVMPRAFRWPDDRGAWLLSRDRVPPSPVEQTGAADREVRYFDAVGRLRPEVSPAQVGDELARLGSVIAAGRPAGAEERRFGVTPLEEDLVGEVRPVILTLQAGVGVVLLIACANISSLLIARTTGRRREMAVRVALGARASRLVRQLLTESLVLGVAGGALGLLIGSWLVTLLLRVLPSGVPRTDDIAIDGTVAILTLLVALVAGALFGALPALLGSRTSASTVMRADGGRGATAGRTVSRAALVVVEIALTLVLLVSAGLLGNSLLRLQQVDPGFVEERATVAAMAIPQTRYPDDAALVGLYGRLLDALESQSSFEAAGIGFPGPLRGDNASGTFYIEGRESLRGADRPFAHIGSVSGGYFDAMGIELLAGRTFASGDTADAPGVAIVSETLARRYWPGEQAVGRRVKFDQDPAAPWITVVGVTSDVRQLGLNEPPPALLYFPYQQFVLPFTNITVRSRADDGAVAESLRTIVGGVDPELPFSQVVTLEDLVGRSLAAPRFRTAVFAVFAVLALTLAAVGLYGLISYTVAGQAREIGIRIALGATAAQVITPIVRRGMTLALAGIAAGLVGSWFAARALARFLFGITATDPLTFAAVAGVLLAVALVATYIPSRRASGVDPIQALRE